MKLSQLQSRHPAIHYLDYSFHHRENQLEIEFKFKLEPNLFFHPKLTLSLPFFVDSTPDTFIDNAVFHLGLIELLSYYKASLPTKIIIYPYRLSQPAVNYWQNLYLNGLSEFIYTNQLPIEAVSQTQFFSPPGTPPLPKLCNTYRPKLGAMLVPIGGGKDSATTISLLDRHYHDQITPFFLNPLKPALQLANHYHLNPGITVTRTIDPQLLQLNQIGYLNGHTPFSAYLAFLTVLAGGLSGHQYIVLSNERSANVPVTTLGQLPVNHQYSKSFQFEANFRRYVAKYLVRNLNYFSFLRPLWDLQITKLYAQFPSLFKLTNSCNRYHRLHAWCGRCPKCLFVYLSLSAFLPPLTVSSIFGSNLLNNLELNPIYLQLLHPQKTSPLDCIGTKSETAAASYLAINQYQKHNLPLPQLLTQFAKLYSHPKQNRQTTRKVLSAYSHKHFLPAHFESILQTHLPKL